MNKELLQQPLEVRLAALMCHYDNEDRPSLKDALRTELAATSAKPAQTYTGDDLAMAYKNGYAAGGVSMATVQGEPVAWMIDGGITLRQDWAKRLHHARHRDGTVGIGRAIPDAWIPVLFAGYRASPQGAAATPQPASGDAKDAPYEAIASILNEVMEIAVSNGANSISMPGEYVEVALWLSHQKPIAAIASQKGAA